MKPTKQEAFILAAQKKGWHVYGALMSGFLFYDTGDGAFYVTGEFVKWKAGYQWDHVSESIVLKAPINEPDRIVMRAAFKEKVKNDITGMFKRGELTKNELEFIMLRYGILRARQSTFTRIGKDFKYTRERVRQVVAAGTLKVWNKYRYWLK